MKFRRLLSHASKVFRIRRKVLFEAPLENLVCTEATAPVKFRIGDASDLLAFQAPENGYDDFGRRFGLERLALGDRLVVGETPSGVVFHAWLMFGQMDLSIRAYRPIPRDAVYSYRVFTVAGFRGQRICPAYYGWLSKTLTAPGASAGEFPAGFRRVITWVDRRNHPSIRSHIRAGFHQVGMIWHLDLCFRHYFVLRGGFTDVERTAARA